MSEGILLPLLDRFLDLGSPHEGAFDRAEARSPRHLAARCVRGGAVLMRPVIVALPLVLALGCSTKSEPGSCYRAPDNACVEYARDQGAAGKRMCSGLTWTAGEQTCPKEKRVGSCAKAKEGVEWLFGGPPNNYSAASAKSACEFGGGVFTPASPP